MKSALVPALILLAASAAGAALVARLIVDELEAELTGKTPA